MSEEESFLFYCCLDKMEKIESHDKRPLKFLTSVQHGAASSVNPAIVPYKIILLCGRKSKDICIRL